jgi:hypothetical protein
MTSRTLRFAVACAAGSAGAIPAAAQRAAAVDVGPYLMPDRAAEIALARSAAPRSISDSATIMVLGRVGFVTAVQGTNGFTCLVVRSLSDPLTSPTRWNPKSVAPHCFNPPAARTVLPTVLAQTAWVIAGLTNEQIIKRFDDGYASHRFVSPAAGAMTYMLSPEQTLGPNNSHWVPHLMFYYDKSASPSMWGVGDSVTTIINGSAGDPNATVLMLLVPVRRWSTGASAMDP